jgi:S-(hydroxymethyl)glutathione dehydrogenase/alcohol dehydrogenase
MDVRAAVATAAGQPLEVTTVQLQGPREGGGTGRDWPPVSIPMNSRYRAPIPKGCFRQSSAVRARASWSCRPRRHQREEGRHVIPLYAPECRRCPSCLSRKTNLYCDPAPGAKA